MDLANIRKAHGFTQADISEQAGISRAAYSNIETGARRPSVRVAKKIARMLGLEWTDFYNDSDNG